MNKRELAKVYSEISRVKTSERQALKEVDMFFSTLQEALEKYGSVMFINKGIFEVVERKPRTIANPATREPMKIYPRKTVKFRASKNIIK